MSQTLYRKYRPQKFSEVIGQKHIVQTLKNAIKNNRTAHAYLLTGSRGTGKTTIARILSTAVNCEKLTKGEPCLKCKNCVDIKNNQSVDIIEIDAASHTGVDNIRELKETITLPPTSGKYKVYIIDEVHMLSQGAFNALLKTLEEPPAHVMFILATTETHKIPETILSRCQRFDFIKFPIDNIIEKLSKITKQEKIKISKESLELIALAAEGGMRDAESILGQIISLEDKNITRKEVAEILGISEQRSIEDVVEQIINGNIESIFIIINNLSKEGCDLEIFTKSLLNYLRKIILASSSNDAKELSTLLEMSSEQTEKIKTLSSKISISDLILIIDNLLEAQGKIKSSFIPQLPLEMAFIKSLQKNIPSSTPSQSTQQIPNTPQAEKPRPREELHETTTIKTVSEKKDIAQKAETTSTEIIAIKKNAESKNISKKPSANKEATESKEDVEVKKNTTTAKPVQLDEVLRFWKTVTTEISTDNKSLASFLSTCRPIEVQEKNVIIISTKYDFHKEKIMEMTNRLTIENILDKILESAVRINVSVEEKDDTETAEYFASLNRDENEGQSSSENGNTVTDALNIFGGKVVEES
ncbi:DNA polymerase III subunit gamma/tau [Patescibacteria group bacterium]